VVHTPAPLAELLNPLVLAETLGLDATPHRKKGTQVLERSMLERSPETTSTALGFASLQEYGQFLHKLQTHILEARRRYDEWLARQSLVESDQGMAQARLLLQWTPAIQSERDAVMRNLKVT